MPHGITQCYLPPGRGDIPALTTAEAGTRLSDPKGCRAELTVSGTHAARLVVVGYARVGARAGGFPARREQRRVVERREVVVRVAVEVSAQSVDLAGVATRQIDERLRRYTHQHHTSTPGRQTTPLPAFGSQGLF